MNRTLLNCLTLAGLATMLPTVANAQCRTCAQPMAFAPPVNCTFSQTRPVVTTQLRPQQVTTYRDVTETRVQRQQVVENVPVTTCKNVTVDEGGYQMVWVPRPVTKQFAETTVRQQVKTVDVPVQVVRRVPQVTTQMVPVQSVQYVTQQVPVQAMAMAQPFCDTCSNGQAFGMPLLAPQLGYLPPVYQPAPYATATFPQPPVANYAAPQTAAMQAQVFLPSNKSQTPAPDASRPTSPAADAYETVPAREVPMPKDEAATPVPVRKTSMFSGVPSAAAVWQSRNSSIR
jgi:hypothetical protein